MAKQKKTDEPETKEQSVQLAIQTINKQFGKGSVVTKDPQCFPHIDRIPSGSLSLDLVLGGGYARGRLIEIYGPESAGKTTLALHAIAETQKTGGAVAFIDMEHAFDAEYASKLGVDTDSLLFSQPDHGEQALDIVDILTRTGAIDLIIIDSVAALVPLAELEGEMSDNQMGLHARLMSKACRKLAGIVKKSNTCIIFINQIRMKIGVMFGSPETVTGGNALKFYASQRLDIRRTGILKDGDDKVGISTRVKGVKNKVAPPFREAEFNIIFGEGIDWATDLIRVGVLKGKVDKAGAWYSYKDERLGQGEPNAAKTLRANLDLATRVRNDIEGKVNVKVQTDKEESKHEDGTDSTDLVQRPDLPQELPV